MSCDFLKTWLKNTLQTRTKSLVGKHLRTNESYLNWPENLEELGISEKNYPEHPDVAISKKAEVRGPTWEFLSSQARESIYWQFYNLKTYSSARLYSPQLRVLIAPDDCGMHGINVGSHSTMIKTLPQLAKSTAWPLTYVGSQTDSISADKTDNSFKLPQLSQTNFTSLLAFHPNKLSLVADTLHIHGK